MNIRHKVAIKSCRNTKGPNAVSQRLPYVDVEDLAQRWAPAACLGVSGFNGQEGLVS